MKQGWGFLGGMDNASSPSPAQSGGLQEPRLSGCWGQDTEEAAPELDLCLWECGGE